MFEDCHRNGNSNICRKIALPSEDVVVTVKIEDVPRADAPAVTIGQQIIENPGPVPIPFEIEYNPADIDERYAYALRARIEVDRKLWFINNTVRPNLTLGLSSISKPISCACRIIC